MSTKTSYSELSPVGYLYFEFVTSTNKDSFAIKNLKMPVASKKPDLVAATLKTFTIKVPTEAE
jgi:hypothetical protein